MSMTAAAIGGAALGAIGQASSGPIGTAVNYAFGKRDRRDSAEVDFKQYQRQRMFDYQFDSTLGMDLARAIDNKDYELARRYAENSASWAVQGLRNAGLNPILAAGGGFNSSNGFQGSAPVGSSGGVPHASGNSFNSRPDVDLMGNLLRAGSLDVQSSTASKLRADSELSTAQSNVAQAQADNIKADTLKTYIQAINEGRSGGQSGALGLFETLGSDFGDGASSSAVSGLLRKHGLLPDSIKQQVGRGVDWLKSSGVSPTNRNSPPSNASQSKVWLSDLSTAKDVANEVSPSPHPVILRDEQGNPYYGPDFKRKSTKDEPKRFRNKAGQYYGH